MPMSASWHGFWTAWTGAWTVCSDRRRNAARTEYAAPPSSGWRLNHSPGDRGFLTPRGLGTGRGGAIIHPRSLPCSTAGKTFALSLKNDTGDATTPGVHVRHVAGSPKVSDRSHLNLGFKVVSPHRHGGEPFTGDASARGRRFFFAPVV